VKAPKSGWVVLFRGGALGDFILALPLLKAFRRSGFKTCVVSRRTYTALLPDWLCDEYIDQDAPEVMRLYAASGGTEPGGGGTRLQRVLPGAIVGCFGIPDCTVDANLRAFGVQEVHWLAPHPTKPPHAIHQFAAGLGLSPGEIRLDEPVWTPPMPGQSLWIHPGSGSVRKNCPVDLFARLAQAWQRYHQAPVFLSFGEADRELLASCRGEFARYGIGFRTLDQPSLATLRDALVRYAIYYVGNDSGVSHLAGALGIPCTVFFRSTDPHIWRPVGQCRTVRYPEAESASPKQLR